MRKTNVQRKTERVIHIRLPGEIHRRLRIRAAELETTIQNWVAETIAGELDRQGKRKRGGS